MKADFNESSRIPWPHRGCQNTVLNDCSFLLPFHQRWKTRIATSFVVWQRKRNQMCLWWSLVVSVWGKGSPKQPTGAQGYSAMLYAPEGSALRPSDAVLFGPSGTSSAWGTMQCWGSKEGPPCAKHALRFLEPRHRAPTPPTWQLCSSPKWSKWYIIFHGAKDAIQGGSCKRTMREGKRGKTPLIVVSRAAQVHQWQRWPPNQAHIQGRCKQSWIIVGL